MGSVEHDRMAHHATQGRGACFGEHECGGLLVRRLAQANFHEFMRGQGLVEGLRHRRADAPFANENDRFQWVCKAAQVAALRAVEAEGLRLV